MNDFNFFDVYTGGRKDFKKEYFYAVILSICLVLFITFTYVYNRVTIGELNSEIKNTQQNLNQNAVKLKEIQNEEKKLVVMNKYYGIVSNISNGLNNNDFVGSKAINKINSCVPKGVYFKVITLNVSGVQLQAEAKDKESIPVFERALENIDIIKQVYIDKITASSTQKGAFTFSVNCVLKDVDNYENK